MTNNVLLKRAFTGLFLISILVNCDMWNSRFGREEIKLGEYATLEVEEPVEGQRYKWEFTELPEDIIPEFLPADTLNQVSFQPEKEGKWTVHLTITLDEEVEEHNYYYDVVMSEDSSLVVGEIPEHLYGYDTASVEETTVADTPTVSLTEDGDQRRYISKIVPPGQSKSSGSSKRATTRTKTRPSSATKLSRGNLIPLASRTYTIQVSSWPSLDEAQSASRELLDKFGVDSYIQRAFFKDKDEIYYRLRVGNFKESKDAEAYAKEIQDMTSLPVWVDFVRQEM